VNQNVVTSVLSFHQFMCVGSYYDGATPNDSGQRTGATGHQHAIYRSPPGSLRRDGSPPLHCFGSVVI